MGWIELTKLLIFVSCRTSSLKQEASFVTQLSGPFDCEASLDPENK